MSTPATAVGIGVSLHADAMEQWEHIIVRCLPDKETVDLFPTHLGYEEVLGNALKGWNGLFEVLDHLGADGWQLVQVEDVNDLGTSGRMWLKRLAQLPRVARREDILDSIH